MRVPRCLSCLRAALLGTCLLASSPAAAGTAVFDLLWTGKNMSAVAPTTTIAAGLGDTLELSIFLTPGSEGVIFYNISLAYDNASGLEVINPEEITPPEFDGNIAPGVTVAGGFISSFGGNMDIGNLGPVGSTPLLIGIVDFEVLAGILAGPTSVTSGYFHVDDGCGNNSGGSCSTFGTATVTLIPEPSTALLLAPALAFLACRRRR